MNGIGEADIFLDHYTRLVNSIPQATIDALNTTIQQRCKEALSMGKDVGDMEATKVDLPCLTDGVTSTQTSSTSVAMESSPLVFTEAVSYFTCTHFPNNPQGRMFLNFHIAI